MAEIKIIAISGGSGSGKSTLARSIYDELGKDQATIIYQDSYYIDQSEKFDEDGGAVNFDHPSSLEFSLLLSHLKELKNGHAVHVPIYDFSTHSRSNKSTQLTPLRYILVDGTLILSQKELLSEIDLKIFLDVPESVRFERRLHRDTLERGRHPEGVKKQFFNQVKPMHDEFVEKSKFSADFIFKHGESSEIFLRDMLLKIEKL